MNFENLVNTHRIRGIVFDMDGVISDTANLHLKSWEPIAKIFKVSMTLEICNKLRGRPRKSALKVLIDKSPLELAKRLTEIEKTELCDYKNEIYKKCLPLLSHKNILPGVTELIKYAKQSNLKLAVASSSKNVIPVLTHLGLLNSFDYIANINHIKRGKPAPDIFLDAIQGLGLSPMECLGIEDAPCGITAINAAHMLSIGVGPKDRLGHANIILNSLAELTFTMPTEIKTIHRIKQINAQTNNEHHKKFILNSAL